MAIYHDKNSFGQDLGKDNSQSINKMHVYKRSLTPVPETACRPVVPESPFAQNFTEFESIHFDSKVSPNEEIESSKGILRSVSLQDLKEKNIKASQLKYFNSDIQKDPKFITLSLKPDSALVIDEDIKVINFRKLYLETMVQESAQLHPDSPKK